VQARLAAAIIVMAAAAFAVEPARYSPDAGAH